MPDRMASVRESPWALKVAAIGSLLVLFGPAAAYAPTKPYLESIVVVGALFIFVLAGSRVGWVLATLLMGGAVIGTAFKRRSVGTGRSATSPDLALAAVVAEIWLASGGNPPAPRLRALDSTASGTSRPVRMCAGRSSPGGRCRRSVRTGPGRCSRGPGWSSCCPGWRRRTGEGGGRDRSLSRYSLRFVR
jgi:hypothetical protein